ncbi:MAG: hypothetical protein ACI8UD_000966 [Planctomycetota bacterium]|jgi:hypothetical protein
MNNQTHTPNLLDKIDPDWRDAAGTWGAPAADHFIATDGGWRNPTLEV